MGCIQNKVKATAFGEISYTGHGINATNNINHVWHKILEEKEVTFFLLRQLSGRTNGGGRSAVSLES